MNPIRYFARNIKDYLSNSNIHGLKYIVHRKIHWSERLIWLTLCILSWYACIVTIISIHQNFVEKPVAITVDTSYLDWRSPFPAVAICSNFNQQAKDYAAAIFKKYSNGTLSARSYAEQLFLPSRMGYLKRLERLGISSEEYVEIYKQAEPDCPETFAKCEWNNNPFDCCNEFVTLHTGFGYCQMLNSKHAKSVKSTIDFSVDRMHKYAKLSLDFTDEYIKSNSDVQIFILNQVEIPSLLTSSNKILKNIDKIIGVDFNLLEVVNEDGVKNTPYDKRECRFPEENNDVLIYELYSYDGCITDVEVRKMLKICGCISYSYPYKPGIQVCNMTGMGCISELRRYQTSLNNEASDCSPDCEATSINWYMYDYPLEAVTEGTAKAGLRMKMLSTPHMRYQRYVARSLLDLLNVFVALSL
ncbi:sodium channel protein Nach isoform X2 [Phymastichus coffea]|uniref:sodium channel protein Nach isoform X2 n=1 Tax=Phymastichus coffea TaxID=108790 RepID=UPI00273C2B7D|nr:sodium channel protein Nach isoform X2 [Phymastichus coffea]